MREATKNSYHQSINRVIDYINDHLADPVDLAMLAETANISGFHFHRIFKAFIGESPGAYISRLRLERAAQHLKTTQLTLTEIAEKTGYQSQYALSKAFKKHFGVTPTAFRNIRTFFSSQFQSATIEPSEIEPEMREVKRQVLVYIRVIAKYGSAKDYDTAWMKLMQFAEEKGILTGHNEFIGFGFDDPTITKPERCRFYACITTDKKVEPTGEFGTMVLEAGTYAVFTLKGPYSGLSKLYDIIYNQWLPASQQKLCNSMPYEKYLNNPEEVAPSDLLTEIFMPVES